MKNLRKLTRGELEVFRISTVKMVTELWVEQREVAKIQWIYESLLSSWMKLYKKSWIRWLKLKEVKWRWRPKDTEKNLTTREKKRLEKLLLKEPRNIEQLKVDSSLWTANVVKKLVEVEFWKKLKTNKLYDLLKELWFSCQKPIFRAYQQNLEKVKEWKEELRPKIEKEAKEEWREILYWDEAGFRSTDHKWTTWWKVWVTPIVKATWARFWINAASAISKQWYMKFMTYEWSFTSDTLIEFLERIVYKTDKKFTLILDWHPTHKTKKVDNWLEKHNFQIKLYYLPPYSPELNPDEQVWKYTKWKMRWAFMASKKEIRAIVAKNLFSLQKKKELISSFFRHPDFV